MAKVGFIGMGNMGSPMAINLVKAGHEVFVWNRTAAKADDAVAAGAKLVDSAKAAAEAGDFVISMVADGPTLHTVALGDGIVAGLSDGKIYADMSTVSVKESKEVNDAVEAAGAKFLRAPVTGSTVLAANGTIGILASGDKAAYDKFLPLFEAMGDKQFYLGSADEARVMKLALNLMIAAEMQLEAEAVVLAEKSGLDVAQVTEIIAGSAPGSPLMGYKAAVIASGKYEPPAFRTNLMVKDLKLALAVADEVGVKLPATELTKEKMDAAVEKGYGDSDFSVLTKILEEESGINR